MVTRKAMEKMVTKKAMEKMVWFDMDGTIADLYGVEGWLPLLRAGSTLPYEAAACMVNMAQLAKLLHKVQAAGWRIGIISWTSKAGSSTYNQAVAYAKRKWLKKHLPSVTWDEINIVNYGYAKHGYRHTDDDILFDDEAYNRLAWVGKAYEPDEIITVLKTLIA